MGLKNAEKTTMIEDTKKTVAFRDLGCMDYQEAWTYQENLFAAIVAQKYKIETYPRTNRPPHPTTSYLWSIPMCTPLGKVASQSTFC